MNTQRSTAEDDAYAAALRAGYGHGYDIGRAHGRAETKIDAGEHVIDGVPDAPLRSLDGPDRTELLARGYIPRDHSRPPALPVRMWDATDWAKADTRDLPTTEHGRAQWRAALDAGRVPPDLADALIAAVAHSGRQVADLRAQVDATAAPEAAGHLEQARRAPAPERSADDAAERDAAWTGSR